MNPTSLRKCENSYMFFNVGLMHNQTLPSSAACRGFLCSRLQQLALSIHLSTALTGNIDLPETTVLCRAVLPKCTKFMSLIRFSSHQYGKNPTWLISFLAKFSKGRDLQLLRITYPACRNDLLLHPQRRIHAPDTMRASDA